MTSVPQPPEVRPLQVVLVGNGARARAWAEVVTRSPRLSLVGQVIRPGGEAPLAKTSHTSISAALEAFPRAAFLVALPPRSGLAAALELAQAGRLSVIEAPLAAELAQQTLPEGAGQVQAALGWATLSGLRFLEQILARWPIERISIETRGLPEAQVGDLDEVLVHAAALVLRLCPGATLNVAERADVGLATASLQDGERRVALRVLTAGSKVEVRLEGRGVSASWSVDDGMESFRLSEGRAPPPRPARSGEERAVAQLFTGETSTTLAAAQQATRLAQSMLDALGERLPPGARRMAQAAALQSRRADDLLAQLGLVGEVPTASPAPVIEEAPAFDEQWAFRAGLKPVAFLTLKPEEVDSTLAAYGDVHVERRERRVHVGAQDTWVDRRDLGEARTELYVSRDPALARRAADVQSLADPSAQLRVMGELMGYPPCCIEAFARQDDRANNTRNRYASVARTRSAGPWPWLLNNLDRMLVPFFPCRYDCPAALAWAGRALMAFETAHPDSHHIFAKLLGRPVLYFDHERQVSFDGTWSGGRLRYRGVATTMTQAPFARFAGALALGNSLALTDDALTVWRDDMVVMDLRRTDPALGFVAPFTPSSGA